MGRQVNPLSSGIRGTPGVHGPFLGLDQFLSLRAVDIWGRSVGPFHALQEAEHFPLICDNQECLQNCPVSPGGEIAPGRGTPALDDSLMLPTPQFPHL